MSMHVLLLHPYEVCTVLRMLEFTMKSSPPPPPIIAQTQGLDKAGGREATKFGGRTLGWVE